MRLPCNPDHISLALLSVALASVHAVRAYPMPTSSLDRRLDDSATWGVALNQRSVGSLPGEFHPSLNTRGYKYDHGYPLEARHDHGAPSKGDDDEGSLHSLFRRTGQGETPIPSNPRKRPPSSNPNLPTADELNTNSQHPLKPKSQPKLVRFGVDTIGGGGFPGTDGISNQPQLNAGATKQVGLQPGASGQVAGFQPPSFSGFQSTQNSMQDTHDAMQEDSRDE